MAPEQKQQDEMQRAMIENEILRLSKEGMEVEEIGRHLTPIGRSTAFGQIKNYVQSVLTRFEIHGKM